MAHSNIEALHGLEVIPGVKVSAVSILQYQDAYRINFSLDGYRYDPSPYSRPVNDVAAVARQNGHHASFAIDIPADQVWLQNPSKPELAIADLLTGDHYEHLIMSKADNTAERIMAQAQGLPIPPEYDDKAFEKARQADLEILKQSLAAKEAEEERRLLRLKEAELEKIAAEQAELAALKANPLYGAFS